MVITTTMTIIIVEARVNFQTPGAEKAAEARLDSTYQHSCDGEGHGAEEQPHPAGRDVTLLFDTCHAFHFSKPMSNFTSFIRRGR